MAIKQYFKADVKAPRLSKKVFNILGSNNHVFYNELKEQYPELSIYSNSEIRKFIKLYNKRIAQEVINNRNGVRLTDGLGVIVAGTCAISKETSAKNINWGQFQKNDVTASHQNLDTDSYIVKIKYSNEMDKHMFDNRHMWCFDGNREFARSLAAEYKKPDGWKKYILFTSRQHISHLFRKNKSKIKSIKKKEINAQKNLSNHDEFAFN